MEQLSLFKSYSKKGKGWLLIDGNNLLNRCYYATVNKTSSSTSANALFLKMMLNYHSELNMKVAVMFDLGRGFRSELWKNYKENRKETPELLRRQFPLLKEILEEIEIPFYEHFNFEADDLIASFVEEVKDEDVRILSNDKDLLQLVTSRVRVIARKGQHDITYCPSMFKKEYDGLSPIQIIDLKAIMGDNSDNIPGIKGIGKKGATKLIQTFSTVERIIENIGSFPKELKRYEEKFASNYEQAQLAKKLITLQKDVGIKKKSFNLNRRLLDLYISDLQRTR